MADFCKQCSIDTFGSDHDDLAGLTRWAEWQEGRACSALCEGCGPIQVDPTGNCVSQDCLCQGQPGHGLPWIKPTEEEQPDGLS